jgi:uncharacterized protein YabE (DUF348 family)
VRIPAARRPWRWKALRLLVLAAILAAWFGSGLGFQREVTLSFDGTILTLRTSARTVAEVLEEAEVCLGPHDSVRPAATALVTDGLAVDVRRAVTVVVRLDGREVVIRTTAATVGEIAATTRLPIRPDDRLEPGRDYAVAAGLRLTVTRVTKSYQHREEVVACRVVRQEDMAMNLGQNVVLQEGENGLLQRLLLVTYEGDRVTETQELSRTMVREPKDRVLRVGTAGSVVRDGQTIKFLKALPVTATAYEPGPISCGASATGYTCLGLRATRGIIAVDPRVIPFWTKVYVEGYGFAVAGDSGSAIKGDRIDVCFDTYEEAIRWGVKHVKVYILELPG